MSFNDLCGQYEDRCEDDHQADLYVTGETAREAAIEELADEEMKKLPAWLREYMDCNGGAELLPRLRQEFIDTLDDSVIEERANDLEGSI